MDDESFKIQLSSDCRYEQLTAEIYYAGDLICILNQDKGIDDVALEMFPRSMKAKKITFPLNEFYQKLDEAIARLKERNRVLPNQYFY